DRGDSYTAILDTQTMDPLYLQLGHDFMHEFSSDGTRLLAVHGYIPCVFKFEADKVAFWRLPGRSGLSRRQGFPVWSPNGQWMLGGNSFWKSQEKDWAKSRWTLPIDTIVSWSPDSKRFLAYAGGSGIEHELWSPHDRKPLAAFEQNHGLFAASWSPDGSQFAMGSGGEVVVLNGTSGQILRRWKAAVDPNEPGQVPYIAWSRRGNTWP
ncbi:MAG: PD40 domain-containing protein, partial [Planctomycetaceae bacterium]|nr:PD40 domain-containing protein [Planctomycetaceae bacterium]